MKQMITLIANTLPNFWGQSKGWLWRHEWYVLGSLDTAYNMDISIPDCKVRIVALKKKTILLAKVFT